MDAVMYVDSLQAFYPYSYRKLYHLSFVFLGLVSASKKSVTHVLSRENGGNAAVIVIGGAEESLDAHPGNLTLHILKRKGFIKVALKRGWVPMLVMSANVLTLHIQQCWYNGKAVGSNWKAWRLLLGFFLQSPSSHRTGTIGYVSVTPS